jgi:thiamine biosynthesis lipoprotein
VITRQFRAMGTVVELLVEADDAQPELDAAESEFYRLEALLSRFRPDSELSRLNEAKTLAVDPDLTRVVELALQARERTGGRFDPTVHDAVVAAGYDRSFERVPRDVATPPRAAACSGRVRIDGERIELDRDVRLDLGGIGKGFAVERVAAILASAGPCLANAGGDLTVRGAPWPVGLETADDTITLQLERGAIATSGRDRRRWLRNGREQHHLIDPTSGAPADTDLLRVTVVAANAIDAEVWAKALFLAGEERAIDEAGALGLPTVLVTGDGRTRFSGGLR